MEFFPWSRWLRAAEETWIGAPRGTKQGTMVLGIENGQKGGNAGSANGNRLCSISTSLHCTSLCESLAVAPGVAPTSDLLAPHSSQAGSVDCSSYDVWECGID